MKKLIPLFTFTFSLHLVAHAAVPMPPWTVNTARAQPATFEAYQGETLTFEAALTCRGKPLEAPSNYSFFWQTNGMGRYYWEAPANGEAASSPLVGTNILFATWLPSYDVGAKVYNCFIGSPSNNYHAAFQLRLRPSPGATPNTLPLPVPVIDFAKVRVLNPPWESGGGGGGVNTNAVRDIVREQLATNGIRSVDGAARPLPKYLHLYEADDSYPDSAAEYYRQRGSGVPAASCSSVRSGGFLYRNFDYPFDDRAEFVVRMSAGKGRFASVGVAQVGTNLTEQMVTSGKWSKWYKALPGATVDGINEHGVACNINVVDGAPQWRSGVPAALQIHPLAAVRWVLDNAATALDAATNLAARIAFPPGWTQNFHYMVADAEKTYIVENGTATDGDEYHEPDEPVTMTNFQLSKFPWDGMGMERFGLLLGGVNITNVWYTNAYRRETTPPWVTDLADVLAYTNDIYNAWASHPKEYFRNKTTNGQPWWQTVHTSVYDLTNRTLRVAVQEVDDWYVFAVPSAGGTDEAKVRAIASEVVAPVAASVSSLQSSKANRAESGHADEVAVLDANGNPVKSGIGLNEGYMSGVKYIGESPSSPPTINLNDRYLYGGDWNVFGNVISTVNGNLHVLSQKADVSMINRDNATFSNEVAEVAKTVHPQPSPTLRLFDPVLNRWVILKSVNMNITLEVE